jgi:hypothetical protein
MRGNDKQLRDIRLADVLEKRRLDQALNVKEFAVCAGISYSTARGWFHLTGFPAFRGVIFWQDFVQWRIGQNGFKNHSRRSFKSACSRRANSSGSLKRSDGNGKRLLPQNSATDGAVRVVGV